MPEIIVRHATSFDQHGIYRLYRATAAVPGGLARTAAEVNPEYLAQVGTLAAARGVQLVAVAGSRVVGELHTWAPVPQALSHTLGDLTVAVDPEWQGQGVGRALFGLLISTVRRERPQIHRIELIVRESNQRAIALYESLGFRREGRLEYRIRRPDGSFEADIPMAWRRETEPEPQAA